MQLVDPVDVPRFKELGIVANFQPLWACMEDTMRATCIDKIGAKRSQWIYPLGAIIETGAPYALSSDWCVTTFEPMPIIQTAITRQVVGQGPDAEVLTPQHRIDIDTVRLRVIPFEPPRLPGAAIPQAPSHRENLPTW